MSEDTPQSLSLRNLLARCITDPDENAGRLATSLEANFREFEQASVTNALVSIIEQITRPARVPVIQTVGRVHRLCREAGDDMEQNRLERHIQTRPLGIQIQFWTSIINNGGTETAMPFIRSLSTKMLEDGQDTAHQVRILKLMYRAAALVKDHALALDCLRHLKHRDLDDLEKTEASIDRHLRYDNVIAQSDPDGDSHAILNRLEETGDLKTGKGDAKHFQFTTPEALCTEFGWPIVTVQSSTVANLVAPRFFPEGPSRIEAAVTHPAATLAVLKDAQVVGGGFLTVCNQKALLSPLGYSASSRWDLQNAPILAMGRAEMVARISEPTQHFAAALHFMSGVHANYFHLMFERVSSLLVLSDWTPPSGCVMLVDAATKRVPQFSQVLDLVNRWDMPIISLEPGETAQVAELHLPSPCGWSVRHMRDGFISDVEDTHILPEAVAAIRDLVSPFMSTAKAKRRLFITRHTAKDSRMTNGREVEALLREEFQFECFDPATHSFAEQVQAFSEAAITVGASGSGLVGGMFMQPGTLMVPLLRPEVNFAAWSQLGEAAGINVINLAGADLIVTDPRFPTHGHFSIPLDQLANLLTQET